MSKAPFDRTIVPLSALNAAPEPESHDHHLRRAIEAREMDLAAHMIFDRHGPALVRLATRLRVSPEAVGEVVNDAVFSFLRRQETLLRQQDPLYERPAQALRAIVRHRSQNWFVRDNRHRRFEEPLPEGTERPDPVDLEGRLLATHTLRRALAKMAPADAELVIAARGDGKSHRQIADELGVSETTVRNRLNAAMDCLVAVLALDHLPRRGG
jgi:RNA polymerase sigma factor (sigma-70 family)